MLRFLNLFAWLAMGASAAACFADYNWILDMLTHLPMQYLLVLITALAFAIGEKRWLFSTSLFVSIAWNAYVVSPQFFPNKQDTVHRSESANFESSKRYRVVILNVLRTNQKIEQTWQEVLTTNADFIYLMESHPQWSPLYRRSLNQYPHQQDIPHHAYTGVAFLSKHPWSSIEVIPSGIITNPSIDAQFQSLSNLRIIATHPVPPFGAELTKAREDQLISLADRLPQETSNLLIGDFNVSPWSPSFDRVLRHGGLRDVSRGYGPSPTLGPLPTWFGGLKFDHVLANAHIVTVDFQIVSVTGSDHRMLIYDFIVKE